MVDYVPSEKGVSIRYPSTAQLCIDTNDRVNSFALVSSSPFDCQFIQTANLLNGFFTRFSTTEIVLDWGQPNIKTDYNDTIQFRIRVPITGNVSSSGTTLSITTSNYFKVGNSIVLSGLTGAGAALNGLTAVVTSLTGSNPSTAVSSSIVSTIVAPGSYGGFASAYLNITVDDGFYNVAQLLDALVPLLNAQLGTGSAFSITNTNGIISITNSQNTFTVSEINSSFLVYQLGFYLAAFLSPALSQRIIDPDLRIYRFLDFVCPEITYAQDVKDATTNSVVVDTLARFYMAYDESPQIDKYGFPILLGYNSTSIRRAFNPPKQIRWTNGLPLGNLRFQVYGGLNRTPSNASTIIEWDDNNDSTNWMMTIQVSEV
jgi:hypothetical protein